MALIDTLIGFAVSLLIGGLGIYVGARVVTDIDDYAYAIITALVGSVVWWVVAALFSWVPVVGPFVGAILALLAWVGVVNVRYPGGVGNAIAIGLIAWVTTLAVLFVLGLFGVIAPGAVGIPGV